MRPRLCWAALFAICIAGVVARLSVFGAGVHGYDSYALREWTWALVQHPISSFYGLDLEVAPDHLPGDLWILYALGRLTWWVSPGFNFYDVSYLHVLKAVPLIADMGIVVLLFLMARPRLGERGALLVAAAYALNPASIVITGVWGQWDPLSLLVALAAVQALLSRRITLAMVLLTLACLIKPQFGFLVPIFALAWLRSVWPADASDHIAGMQQAMSRYWRTIVRTIGAMLGTVMLVCVPFGVSVTGAFTGWSIVQRLAFALDRYQATTLGANNLWMLPIGRGNPPWDGEVIAFGLTYQEVGTLLVVVCLVAACVLVVRIPDPAEGIIWSATFMMLAAFLFSTRMHERYMFPVVGLSLALCITGSRYWPVALGASIAVFTNVYLSLTWGWGNGHTDLAPLPMLDRDIVPRLLSLGTLVLFAILVSYGIRGIVPAGWGILRRDVIKGGESERTGANRA